MNVFGLIYLSLSNKYYANRRRFIAKNVELDRRKTTSLALRTANRRGTIIAAHRFGARESITHIEQHNFERIGVHSFLILLRCRIDIGYNTIVFDALEK